MKDEGRSRSKVEIATAAAAVASVGGLVALTVTGLLQSLPSWAAVLIVVSELLIPFIVYVAVRRS